MAGRDPGSIRDRLELVRLIRLTHLTKAQAARRLGYSRAWARKWWRRYCHGGEAALVATRPLSPGPLARFSPEVAAAILSYRQTYPHAGARRAWVDLGQRTSLRGQALPNARTIHRAWLQAGLVCGRLPRDTPPPPPAVPNDDLHSVWQIDHQDHIRCRGLDTLLVLQSIRAPRAGLTIGADIFLGPRGAQGVPEDDLFDALRRRFAQWGRPLALSVDGGLRFLGQPQRQFPSRLELLCAGLQVAVVPIRAGRPTDHASVERLHWTLDAVLVDVEYRDLAQVQETLDRQLADLNQRFPSRAKACGGLAPLAVHPEARHTGRPYDPLREWEEFDLAAVDRLLSGWHWHRLVGEKTGQISFADRNVGVGKARARKCRAVDLRFDPDTRRVVIYESGTSPDELGPEIKRFHCPAFDKETILGVSKVAIRPTTSSELRANVTDSSPPGGTTL